MMRALATHVILGRNKVKQIFPFQVPKWPRPTSDDDSDNFDSGFFDVLPFQSFPNYSIRRSKDHQQQQNLAKQQNEIIDG